MKRPSGECEALRLLGVLLGADVAARERAVVEAKKLLGRLSLSPNRVQLGRPMCILSIEQLREIARLDAEGGHSQSEIAIRVGASRSNVAHHLKPSAAMLSVMVGNDQPAEVTGV